MTEYDQAAEKNRQIIQDAIYACPAGGIVDVDKLPLIRVDGQKPTSALFTVPRSAAILVEEQRFSVRTNGKSRGRLPYR
jgi:hypothetical protein